MACFLLFQMRDSNIQLGDSNLFEFLFFCLDFTLRDLDPYVENSNPLVFTFSLRDSNLCLEDLDPLTDFFTKEFRSLS